MKRGRREALVLAFIAPCHARMPVARQQKPAALAMHFWPAWRKKYIGGKASSSGRHS